MKQWYTWTTVEAFDAWHEPVKQALELPKPGINVRTGHVDVTAAWTTDYTFITEVAEGDYRAMVQESIAQQFSEGLGAISESPPLPDEIKKEAD